MFFKMLRFLPAYFLWANVVCGSDTFLFSFEKDEQKSYLIGTSHWIDAQRLPWTLLSFLESKSVLLVESTDALKPLNKEVLCAMGVLKGEDEPSYLNMLGEQDRTELLLYVEPFLMEKGGCVQADHLNLKGLYATYIAGHFLKGLDYWLLNSFKKAHKDIKGLETREDVSAYFEHVSFDHLEKIIKHHAGFESTEAQKIEDDYLRGLLPEEEDPMFQEELQERNLSWFPKLMDYYKENGEEMVGAVGYDHLFGVNGLLSLLSQAGFSLKRMNADGEFIPFSHS